VAVRVSDACSVKQGLRACFKNRRGPVFPEKALWRGATRESRACGMTEEQRSQRAFSGKTLRAAVLLPGSRVGSTVTARRGDAPVSPPWPRSKSLAAGPLPFLKQALRACLVIYHEIAGSRSVRRLQKVCVMGRLKAGHPTGVFKSRSYKNAAIFETPTCRDVLKSSDHSSTNGDLIWNKSWPFAWDWV
jgi:hypothetical protein